MEKFDIEKAKLVSIIGLILFIFVMVIANAYKYLPAESTDIPDVNTEISLQNEPQNTEEETDNEETVSEDSNISEEENAGKNISEDNVSSENNITPLENINDDNNTDENAAEEKTFENSFSEAKRLKDEKQLVKAIDEYKLAISLAETSKQKSDCYEEIATIYALAKKYGTALSFAQKAYNLSPSTNKEILLARLYFKTGNTDKASERINNVLRRDFNFDN